LILASKYPLVIFGRGCMNAREEASLFGYAIDIPCSTTAQMKGMITYKIGQHPYNMVGFGGSERTQKLVKDHCDCLVVVGSSLNEFTTYRNAPWFFKGKKIIRVDIDEGELAKNCTPDIAIQMDAKEFFTHAIDMIPHRHSFRESEVYKKGYARIRHRAKIEKKKEEDGAVPPHVIVDALSKYAPLNTTFIGDGGNNAFFLLKFLKQKPTQKFSIDINTGCLGSSISTAIGAKLAEPDRIVIAVCGDGGFLMSGNEIATAVEYDVPVAYVVFNF